MLAAMRRASTFLAHRHDGHEDRSSSGSLAMLAAMRRFNPRATRSFLGHPRTTKAIF
jgi:DNA-directed RNA polymerase specialized sigma subunit